MTSSTFSDNMDLQERGWVTSVPTQVPHVSTSDDLGRNNPPKATATTTSHHKSLKDDTSSPGQPLSYEPYITHIERAATLTVSNPTDFAHLSLNPSGSTVVQIVAPGFTSLPALDSPRGKPLSMSLDRVEPKPKLTVSATPAQATVTKVVTVTDASSSTESPVVIVTVTDTSSSTEGSVTLIPVTDTFSSTEGSVTLVPVSDTTSSIETSSSAASTKIMITKVMTIERPATSSFSTTSFPSSSSSTSPPIPTLLPSSTSHALSSGQTSGIVLGTLAGLALIIISAITLRRFVHGSITTTPPPPSPPPPPVSELPRIPKFTESNPRSRTPPPVPPPPQETETRHISEPYRRTPSSETLPDALWVGGPAERVSSCYSDRAALVPPREGYDGCVVRDDSSSSGTYGGILNAYGADNHRR